MRNYYNLGKLLQAITYLTYARTLSPTHPSIHKRLIHLRHFTSHVLQQTPPSPSGPIFIQKVDELVPKEDVVSLTTYNNEYLQKFGGSKEWKGRGVLSCVEAMLQLQSQGGEGEGKDGGVEGIAKEEVEGLISRMWGCKMKGYSRSYFLKLNDIYTPDVDEVANIAFRTERQFHDDNR